MKPLNKILSDDWESLIRATFAEDLALLATYDNNVAVGLDMAVMSTIAKLLNSNSDVYRIELSQGAMVGWFAVTQPNSLASWFIRPQARTPEIQAAFNTLVQITFQYGFFNSIGINNVDPMVLAEQDITKITVPVLDYTGKNIVILKASN